MRPPINIAAIDEATKQSLQAGHRILQSHRYRKDDRQQVDMLLDLMAPPQNAMVLDAGCGIGEVSRIMSERRPDLSFVLMNVSLYQLSQCPVGEQFLHAHDDCHATLLNDRVIDCAMFSSSLCQMDIPVALAEAARVMKAGGTLLINDMARSHGDYSEMEAALAARVLPLEQLKSTIEAAGFVIDLVETPPFDDTQFRDMLKQDGIEHLLDGVFPVIIRATKGGTA